jgi:hypothetical protein
MDIYLAISLSPSLAVVNISSDIDISNIDITNVDIIRLRRKLSCHQKSQMSSKTTKS